MISIWYSTLANWAVQEFVSPLFFDLFVWLLSHQLFNMFLCCLVLQFCFLKCCLNTTETFIKSIVLVITKKRTCSPQYFRFRDSGWLTREKPRSLAKVVLQVPPASAWDWDRFHSGNTQSNRYVETIERGMLSGRFWIWLSYFWRFNWNPFDNHNTLC